MTRENTRFLILGLVLLGLVAGVGLTAGWTEALVLGVGLGLLAVTVWLPAPVLRVLAALYLGVFTVVLVRATAGPVWAIPAGLLAAVLCAFVLPERVHRRISFMLPSLVLLVFVTTMLMFLAPGSPFAKEKAASEQVEQALRARYQTPDTASEFFLVYMKRLVEDGTFGPSLVINGRMVEDVLAPAFPVSMTLGLLALLIAAAIGLTLGIFAGLKTNSIADYGSMGLAMIGVSLPNFVIGATLMIIFALNLGWLPVAGWGGIESVVLPAITLALPYAAYIARLARTGTIEVMQQDFVRTARAKGLSEGEVVLKHSLRGAILPVVSFLGPAAAGIFTGSFVVEHLFAIPGMGKHFVQGATGRDYTMVLGTAIIYFTLITVFNLLVDLAYAWLDPRVRGQL